MGVGLLVRLVLLTAEVSSLANLPETDLGQRHQPIVNWVLHALDATPCGGPVAIRADPPWIEREVADPSLRQLWSEAVHRAHLLSAEHHLAYPFLSAECSPLALQVFAAGSSTWFPSSWPEDYVILQGSLARSNGHVVSLARPLRIRKALVHELAITREIVAIATEYARGQRVARVVVEIGRLSGVMPDAVQFCFPHCAAETPVAGAVLEVLETPGRGRCRGCGREVSLHHPLDGCPCGCTDLEWLSGSQIRVCELEITHV